MTKIGEVVAAFDRFDLSSHNPAWSSWALEDWFAEFFANDHGTMADVLRGLDAALVRYEVALTDPVANLIKDVVILGFTRYRGSYDRIDWGWADEALGGDIGGARSYLLSLAMPPDRLNLTRAIGILGGLETSPQFDEALVRLAGQLDYADVQQELRLRGISGTEIAAKRRA